MEQYNHYKQMHELWTNAGSKKHDVDDVILRLRDIDNMMDQYIEIAENVAILVVQYYQERYNNLDVRAKKPNNFAQCVSHKPGHPSFTLNLSQMSKQHQVLINVIGHYIGV